MVNSTPHLEKFGTLYIYSFFFAKFEVYLRVLCFGDDPARRYIEFGEFFSTSYFFFILRNFKCICVIRITGTFLRQYVEFGEFWNTFCFFFIILQNLNFICVFRITGTILRRYVKFGRCGNTFYFFFYSAKFELYLHVSYYGNDLASVRRIWRTFEHFIFFIFFDIWSAFAWFVFRGRSCVGTLSFEKFGEYFFPVFLRWLRKVTRKDCWGRELANTSQKLIVVGPIVSEISKFKVFSIFAMPIFSLRRLRIWTRKNHCAQKLEISCQKQIVGGLRVSELSKVFTKLLVNREP